MLRCLILFGLSLIYFNVKSQFDYPPESVAKKAELRRMLGEAFCPSNVPKNQRIYGGIDLLFTIRKDGSTESLHFVKGLNDPIDKEVARIFPMIQWLPGIIGEDTVDAEHLLEFRIKPSFFEDSTLCMKGTFENVVSYELCEEKPIFRYGDFNQWVYKKLNYPESALKKGIQGTVMTRFVVEKNGALSNIAVSKSVGGGCDEEAIRVVSLSKWTPGKREGKTVRTQIFYPITFQLSSGSFNELHTGDMIRGK